jgi:hypothetical protein
VLLSLGEVSVEMGEQPAEVRDPRNAKGAKRARSVRLPRTELYPISYEVRAL